ncbi:MAG TPA: LicD family protein [Anaerolineae bacterium]|nr:LicD family protein [Anaerolineae bacterium]
MTKLAEWYYTSESFPARRLRSMRRGLRVIKKNFVALNFVQRRRFKRNLVRLHDALAQTDFAHKYWVIDGLLLGWARTGQIIPWDTDDADFAYLGEDRSAFAQARAKLSEAGFSLSSDWRNNAGEITATVFTRDGIRFDFFEMQPQGNQLLYTLYGRRNGIWQELKCAVPRHGLADMPFLDRIWQKPDDHDIFLRAVYGEWRKSDPGYDYASDEKNVVGVTPRKL